MTETSRPGRARWVVCAIVLLMLPAITYGQHRGGRGAGSRSSPTGVSDSESPETKEFERAAAIHARPEQIAQFQQLTRTGQVVRDNTRKLLQVAETVGQIDLFHYTGAVTSSVEEVQFENEQFLLSFSDAQKSGLKELTKKLSKVNAELTKENKALGKELERSRVSGKLIGETAKRLDKAFSDFQSQQIAVGTEMGIQGI